MTFTNYIDCNSNKVLLIYRVYFSLFSPLSMTNVKYIDGEYSIT